MPIFWSSKLQSEISLSTLKAGYIAMPQGMIDLVFSRNWVQELGKQMKYDLNSASQVSKAWEDNIEAQNLANGK